MKIGIGSTNKSKMDACQKAFDALNRKFLPDNRKFDLYPIETITSIPDMPLNKNDLMKGALERALFVYNHFHNEGIILDYTIGLEGGVYQEVHSSDQNGHVFLQSWVYAYNGNTGFFGSSPALPLPQSISKALFHDKRELSEVIDAFSGQNDVRSNEGAFGILTRDLITRSMSFYLAIINSMIPFLNKQYYS